VIFELDNPDVLLGMALGLVAAILLHNLVQTLAARFSHDGTTRMARRGLWDPKREFEPFGVVAMIIAGMGWGRPVEMSEPRGRGGRRGRYIANLLAGPAAVLALGAAGLVVHQLLTGDAFGRTVLGQASVTCILVAVLYLIPLPPLDGARIMWVLAPSTAGWQKARYYLEEQNYGLGILILLLLPIFGGQVGLIGRIVNAVAEPIVDLITRSV
jgi:Zn-dependent protease